MLDSDAVEDSTKHTDWFMKNGIKVRNIIPTDKDAGEMGFQKVNELLKDAKENIRIKHGGKHKDYFQEFFKDTFYNQLDTKVRSTIPQFLGEIFNMTKPFTKSDLDIMTELYKCLEKNIED